MTSDSDDVNIDMTLDEYKKVATDQLNAFGAMFDDPEFRRIMGDEMADSIKAINDEKLAQIKEIPDE
jgi:hypothetical protein